ncbi:hypothetical protein [Paenibacillus motobuensis]|uniref:Uncharacterized protein n=1 Tax=Paenibacillus motobuensis TaxID=295324 RepID=A0ABN0Y1U3_9BACL
MITNWKGILLALAGGLIMIQPLRKLLPKGTLTARKGLPATIASRGLFVALALSLQLLFILVSLTVSFRIHQTPLDNREVLKM